MPVLRRLPIIGIVHIVTILPLLGIVAMIADFAILPIVTFVLRLQQLTIESIFPVLAYSLN
jgi:hypothetical protein